MSNFKATLYGFDYYIKDGLFKDLSLPSGIDKDVLVSLIMKECGEMTPVFTDPEFMQQMIGAWSVKWFHTFQKWVTALNIKYDPLSNYDRTEEWTTDTASNVSGTASETSGASSSNETQKSAYDSSTYTPYDKVIGSSSNTTSSNTSDNAIGNEKKTGHTYGNIGVTTSQQMLQAELDIAEWNIYDHIKDLFMQEFCIMIY